MNFSRFETWVISALLFAIAGSTGLSLILVNQQVLADVQVKSAFRLPKNQVTALAGNLPQIDDVDLSDLSKKVQAITDKQITVTWVQGDIKVPKKDLESFVVDEINGGVATADLDDQAITNFIVKLAKRIDIKAKPRQVTQDGELIDEGRKGRKLDRDQAKNALLQAILSEGDNKQIALKVDEEDAGEKIVAKPFTPGLYDGKYVEINLSTQTMYVFEGNKMINQYAVSTGKWSMPTPEGSFAINNKVDVAYSKRYDLNMPNWMSFVGSKYGIHGLPYKGKWVEGASHLGQRVSHGCVRLSWEDAIQLYDWAEIGTIVYIHS